MKVVCPTDDPAPGNLVALVNGMPDRSSTGGARAQAHMVPQTVIFAHYFKQDSTITLYNASAIDCWHLLSEDKTPERQQSKQPSIIFTEWTFLVLFHMQIYISSSDQLDSLTNRQTLF